MDLRLIFLKKQNSENDLTTIYRQLLFFE